MRKYGAFRFTFTSGYGKSINTAVSNIYSNSITRTLIIVGDIKVILSGHSIKFIFRDPFSRAVVLKHMNVVTFNILPHVVVIPKHNIIFISSS